MALVDNRPGGASSSGGVITINGQNGNVVISTATLGAVDKPVFQGSALAPLLVNNASLINLSVTKSEILYLQANGADFNLSMANFTGIKPQGLYLKIIIVGAFALTFLEAGNFDMNGDRRSIAGSVLSFTSDGVGYKEDGGNEIL